MKMTLENYKEIYKNEKENGMGSDKKDSFHTMSELYFHRLTLFAFIVKSNKDKSWKSKLHADGDMFEDFFIVGVDTPSGTVAYHYQMKYWNFFECRELERAPEWDGTTADEIYKLFSLFDEE